MKAIVRMIFGLVLIVGAVTARSKASDAGDGATLYFWGVETSPTAFSVIIGVVVLIGLVMIGMGVKGLLGKAEKLKSWKAGKLNG